MQCSFSNVICVSSTVRGFVGNALSVHAVDVPIGFAVNWFSSMRERRVK